MTDDVSKDAPDSHAARRIPPVPDRVTQPAFNASSIDRADTEPERTGLVSNDLNRELLRKAREQFRERNARSTYRFTSANEAESEPIVISNDVILPSAETQFRATRIGDAPLVAADGLSEPARSMPDVFDRVEQVVPEGPNESPALSQRTQGFSETSKSLETDAESATPSGSTARRIDRPEPWEMPVPDPWRTASRVEPDLPPARIEVQRAVSLPKDDQWQVEENDFLEWQEPIEESESLLPSRSSGATLEPLDNDDRVLLNDWEGNEVLTPVPPAQDFAPGPVWGHLPRCCGTCKDFRSTDGRRGWCTNQWAFKHRRMVDADDRPCETSIGHWWIPGDFTWEAGVDPASFNPPTPLMDKYVDPVRLDEGEEQVFARRRRS